MRFGLLEREEACPMAAGCPTAPKRSTVDCSAEVDREQDLMESTSQSELVSLAINMGISPEKNLINSNNPISNSIQQLFYLPSNQLNLQDAFLHHHRRQRPRCPLPRAVLPCSSRRHRCHCRWSRWWCHLRRYRCWHQEQPP